LEEREMDDEENKKLVTEVYRANRKGSWKRMWIYLIIYTLGGLVGAIAGLTGKVNDFSFLVFISGTFVGMAFNTLVRKLDKEEIFIILSTKSERAVIKD
jgi:hypothetical protein